MEDYAVFDEEHTVGVAGCLGGVCDHQDCLTVEVDLMEDLKQSVRRPGIQSAAGLIRQDQLRRVSLRLRQKRRRRDTAD